MQIPWDPIHLDAVTKGEPPTGDTRSALDSIRRVVRALRESSRDTERQVGLSGAQLFVLQALAAAGGDGDEARPLSQGELAERTMTHQSSVSVVVRRLVERKLVAQRPSVSDARRLDLTVTARGQALANKAPGPAQARLIAGIERLGPRGRRRLAQALGQLVEAMAIGEGEPAMFFEEDEGRRGSKARAHRKTEANANAKTRATASAEGRGAIASDPSAKAQAGAKASPAARSTAKGARPPRG